MTRTTKQSKWYFTKSTAALVFCAVLLSAQAPQAQGRGMAAPDVPIEPSALFSLPTGSIVQSMDLDVHGSGVLFSGSGSRPVGGLTLGLGDIAQMEMTTLSITSDVDHLNQLVGMPAAGLKVHVPLAQYAQGLAASFQRSGSFVQRAGEVEYETKAGEFYVIGTVANYPRPEHATEPTAGWRGLKIKSHLGAKYIDAQMRREELETGGANESYWRPVIGIEMWRDDARARVIGELNWIAGTSVEGGI